MVAVGRKDKEQFVVTRERGSDLSATIGNLLFRDVTTCIEELVANAHDADSENVVIDYKPDSGLLVISDDGTGMSRDDITGFYRMGDSVKKANPVTPKGRKVIGKHGIASLVLRNLGMHYVLESFKNGVSYRAEETFAERDKDENPITVTSTSTDRKKHGVTITIDSLRFLEDGRTLDVDKLKKRLAVEMPVLPDFSLSLNGVEIKPRVKVDGVEYLIDVEDPLAGRITGSLFYSPRLLEDGEKGIYIKVHGKAVGGTNLDVFGAKSGVGFGSRIFGIVNADSLDDIIGFDRSRFIEHPKFDRVASHIDKVLKQMRQDAEMNTVDRRVSKFGSRLNRVYADVGRFIGGFLDEDPYRLEFNERKAGRVARLDRDKKILYVNPRSPVAALQYIKVSSVRLALMNVAAFALTFDSLPEESRRSYTDLQIRIADAQMKHKEGLLANIIGGKDSADKSFRRISPARLYEHGEVSRILGYSVAVVRDFIDSGIFRDREGRVLGSEVLEVTKKMRGNLPLFEAVRKACGGSDDPKYPLNAKVEALANRFDSMKKRGLDIPSFIENLADEDRQPFYVTNGDSIDELKEFIEHGRATTWQGVRLVDPVYCYRDFSRDGAVLVYALKAVSRDEIRSDIVRRALDQYMKFSLSIGDGEDLPEGVKTASSFSSYSGDNYVFGVYAADYISAEDLKELDKLFDRNGFAKCRVSRDLSDELLKGVLKQRRHVSPLSFDKDFTQLHSAALADMLKVS